MPIYQEKARIIKNMEVAKNIWEMSMSSPKLASAAYAGQFLMLRVRDELSPLLRRPFSFSTIDSSSGMFSILYKVIGHGTRIMTSLKPNDTVDVLGPLGRGFRLPPENARKVWLLAGGIGIAPFFELLTYIKKTKRDLELTLFYGATTANELVKSDFFEDNSCLLNVCTDDGTYGFHGFITGAMEKTCSSTGNPDYFYSCGPNPMQQKIIKWAKDTGISGQVSMETAMACGMGVCLGCSLPETFLEAKQSATEKYLRVCREGPVFTIGEAH